MSALAYSRAAWYSEGLRWIGTVLVKAADHLEQNARENDAADPWPDLPSPDERVFELRNRLHNGYY